MAIISSIANQGVCAAKGFQVSSIYAGVRSAQKDDLMLLLSDQPASVAGVFTSNTVQAWCVQHNRERLAAGVADGVLVSAGCANCCTGAAGKAADLTLATSCAPLLGPRKLLTASTGVIGRQLAVERILPLLPKLVGDLGTSPAHALRAASAIMTTDTKPKLFAIEHSIGGKHFRVGGMAKGSGMIAPNMATMLSFLTCDAQVPAKGLQAALSRVADRSFNCVSVDGDTSTNDMLLCFANGLSGVAVRGDEPEFLEALEIVARELAKMIAADGEGATKLICLSLHGVPAEGRKIAKTIAESPLFKTACYGNDPNWGRILAAAGRAGVAFDPQKLRIVLAGTEVFSKGEPSAFDESIASAAMRTAELNVELYFEPGAFAAGLQADQDIQFWTCDFSEQYVRINADYMT